MFFALTDEQRALQDTVRAFLSDRFGLDQVRAVFEDPDGDGHPAELWKSIAEQGWLAVMVPERYDGIGLGLLDAMVVVRAFGAGVVPGPYAATLLAGEAVRLGGSEAQQERVLGPLAAGELVATLAVRGDGEAWDSSGVTVTASDGRLSGTAVQVEYPHVADRLVVAAREAGGEVGLYLLDPASEGVTVRRYPSLDGTTRLGDVALDAAAGERLQRSSAAVLDAVLLRAAVLAAADLSGIARQALTRTVAYDKDRTQFGRPVGSFQAIKHVLADLHVATTMAEHGVLFAAYAIDAGLPGAELAAHVAKAKASDVGRDTTAAMIQYHGGIGFTWEHETHFFYKRAKRLEYQWGDAATHRERIAQLVVDPAAPAATGRLEEPAGPVSADTGAVANAATTAAVGAGPA